MKKHALFVTAMYETETGIDLSALRDDILAWRDSFPAGIVRANDGANWHSPPDAFHRPSFKPLLESVVAASTEVLEDSKGASGGARRQDIWGDPGGPKKRPHVSRIRIREMWANVSDTGGWHKPHQHGGCAWAGIVYIAGPANSPGTVFMKLSDGEAMSKRVSAHEPGKMVIIPGSLVHYVPPNPGPEPRITVSFNVSVVTRPAQP